MTAKGGNTMFYLFLSPMAANHLSPEFIVSHVCGIFQEKVKRFEAIGLPGEFDRFGGPRGAVVHNLRIALLKCPDEEIRRRIAEEIPGI